MNAAEPSAGAAARPEAICRVMALDGGGAKGFYTLGVLKEIEALVQGPLTPRRVLYSTSS
jgi:predicted acylesterase/phospholipase RssA